MLHAAQLWRDFAAEAALPPADIEPVAAWIERTAKHMDGAATGDLAHFLDADLQVLGKPPAAIFAQQSARRTRGRTSRCGASGVELRVVSQEAGAGVKTGRLEELSDGVL